MPSQWIIDGFNFIRTSRRFAEWEAEAPEAGRTAALEWLGDFSQSTGQAVTVVFDAYSSMERAMKESSAFGITVLESRGSYTADEEILALAQKLGQGAIVVSSDREVQEGAVRAGCSILSSQEFEREVGKIFAAEEEDENFPARKGPGAAFRPPKEKKKAFQLLRKFQ